MEDPEVIPLKGLLPNYISILFTSGKNNGKILELKG